MSFSVQASMLGNNALMALSTNHMQCELESLTTKKETLNSKNHKLNEDLAVTNTELQNMQQRQENFSKEEKMLDEAFLNLQSRLPNKDVKNSNLKSLLTIVKSLEQDMENFKKETPFVHEKMNNLFQSGTGMQKEFRNLQDQAENFSRETENAKVSMETLANKYDDLVCSYDAADSEHGKVQNEYSDVQNQLLIESYENLKQTVKDIFSGQPTELNENGENSLKLREEMLNAQSEELESKMVVYYEKAKNLKPDADDLDTNIAQLQSQADELLETSERVSKEREDCVSRMENVCKDFKEFKDTIKHLHEKINTAEEKIQSIENEKKMLALQQSPDNDSDAKNVGGKSHNKLNLAFNLNFLSNQVRQKDGNKTGNIDLRTGEFTSLKVISATAILGICIFMALLLYFAN